MASRTAVGLGRRAAALLLLGLGLGLLLLAPATAQTTEGVQSTSDPSALAAPQQVSQPDCGGCGPGEFLLKECDTELPADQECQACQASCPMGTFQTAPCTETSDIVCTGCSLCEAGEVELKMCNNQAAQGGDRICGQWQEEPAAAANETANASAEEAASIPVEGEGEEAVVVVEDEADTAPEAEAPATGASTEAAGEGEAAEIEEGAATVPEAEEIETAPAEEPTTEEAPEGTQVMPVAEETVPEIGAGAEEQTTQQPQAGEETSATVEQNAVIVPLEEEPQQEGEEAQEQPEAISTITTTTTTTTAEEAEETVEEGQTEPEDEEEVVALPATPVNETTVAPEQTVETPEDAPNSTATNMTTVPVEETEGKVAAAPPLTEASEVVAVEGTIMLNDMTITEFTASGLGLRMRKAVADSTDLPLEQVLTGSVAAGSVAVEMVAVFGPDQEQQAVAFADQIRTQAPLVFVEDQGLLAFGVEEKASAVDVKFTTYGEVLAEIQAAELENNQQPSADGTQPEEKATKDEESSVNKAEAFFKDLEGKTLSWWGSAPLWQKIVVPLGAGLALLAIISCLVATCCCCRRRRKQAQEKKYADPNYGLYADPRSSEPSYGPAFA